MSPWTKAAGAASGLAVALVVAVPQPGPAPSPAGAVAQTSGGWALRPVSASGDVRQGMPTAEVSAASSTTGVATGTRTLVAAGTGPSIHPAGLASSLAADGIPATALGAYQAAAAAAPAGCGIGWPLIAAIGRVESDHGRFAGAVLHTDGRSTPPVIGPRLDGIDTALVADTDGGRIDGDPGYDHAVGPMQFIPSTWAIYGRGGDPYVIGDAAAATARYLCAAGGDLSATAGQARAVFTYNHSDAYVATVLTLAAGYAHAAAPAIPPSGEELASALPPADPGTPSAAATRAAAIIGATSTSSTSPVPAGESLTTAPPTSTTSAPATSTTPPAGTAGAPTTSTPPPPASSAPTTTAPPTPSTPPPAGPTTPGCTVAPTAPLTVDVIDRTGRPAVADAVASRLTAGGIAVHGVTSQPKQTGTPIASVIEFPVSQRAAAARLAAALHHPGLLRQADVGRVTVVLGDLDPTGLLASLRRFTGLPPQPCPAP